ncbi:hypothetical protein Rs2_16607 [Raphanus sativus]|nr:hypothetical protein Rs2_16607 [Raphanus sativus]
MCIRVTKIQKAPSSDRFKLTQKNKKLFLKRARHYNSDNEEEDKMKKAPEVTIREKISDANMGRNYDEVEEEEDGSDKGPVLSAHKHLIAQKLADEEAEKKAKKAKGQARKAKHLVAEKGHVKPANHLELHEKILIGVATKKEWSSFSML